MDHFWHPIASHQALPRHAVLGGHARNGKPTYVGRCYHEGDLLPALIRPDNDDAFVSWAGRLYIKEKYEILLGPGYGWTPCQHGGGVPGNAVSSGNCSRGEPLYIGRGFYNGTLSVGKIHASHDCLYISHGSKEIRLHDYEVLVKAPADTWQPFKAETCLPSNAVKAGNEKVGAVVYVARGMHVGVNNISMPAKFLPERQEAFVVTENLEIFKMEMQEIEVLCGSNYTWLEPCHNEVPANAVFTDRHPDGEPLIVGRAGYKGNLICGLVANDGSSIVIAVGEKAIRVGKYEILIRHQP